MSGSAEKVEVLHGSHFMPMGGSQFQKPSREQTREAKALEVARKNGSLPHEIDDDGKEVNPHIPQFISKVPWYLDTVAEESKHSKLPEGNEEQRASESKSLASEDIRVAERLPKRSLDNSSSNSEENKHRESKISRLGQRLQGDEVMSWDGKRDRWKGYDGDFAGVFERYHNLDRARLERRSDDQAMDDRQLNEDFVESSHMFHTSTHTSTRNLRIREDRARYLVNLNAPEPELHARSKTTSSEPLGNATLLSASQDGFQRASGSDEAFARASKSAWQQSKKYDMPFNAHANPTESELSRHRLAKVRTEEDAQRKTSILARYG